MKALILFLSLSLFTKGSRQSSRIRLCALAAADAVQCTIGGFFHKGNSDGKEGKGEEVERKEFSPPLPVLFRRKAMGRKYIRECGCGVFACLSPSLLRVAAHKNRIYEKGPRMQEQTAGMRLH